MICSKCGAQHDQDARFCSGCGKPLETEVTKTILPGSADPISGGTTLLVMAIVMGFVWFVVPSDDEKGTSDLVQKSQGTQTEEIPRNRYIDPTDYQDFRTALSTSASCSELYRIKHLFHPHDPNRHRANADLSLVGCDGPESQRKAEGDPTGPTAEGFNASDYQLGYELCRDNSQTIYRESRTRDPEQAARYAANMFVGNPARARYAACLDALRGNPPRYGYTQSN